MSGIKFVRLIPTPGDKTLCLIEIDLHGVVRLLYKINQKKDGTGYFHTPASYKVTEDNVESYQDAWTLGSNYDSEDIKRLISHHVKLYLIEKSIGTTQNQAVTYPHVYGQPNPPEMKNNAPQVKSEVQEQLPF